MAGFNTFGARSVQLAEKVNGLECDLPLRFYERYQCRRDKTRDPVVPLPGFLAKKGATGHEDRDRRAAQTGHKVKGH
jgi:hypothetical protein